MNYALFVVDEFFLLFWPSYSEAKGAQCFRFVNMVFHCFINFLSADL